MEIIKITPRGFCSGVVNAWKQVLETAKKYQGHNIYMLGWFVHNIEMINDIKQNNIVILDDTNTSRYDLVKNNPFTKGDVLILSAHGTDSKTINLAKEIGYIIVDTTCQYVTLTHEVIKNALKANKTVFYLGKKNHPESLASIAIDNKNIKFITSIDDLISLKKDFKDQPIVVTNQTTLSSLDLLDYYEYLNNNFTNLEIKNDLCYATKERQEALINLKLNVDLLIVVGDKKSNNSNQLLQIGLRKNIPSYLVNSVKDLNDAWFKNNYKVAVTSGASTPTKITNQIIQYLEEWKEK